MIRVRLKQQQFIYSYVHTVYGKMLEGENFMVFVDFYSIANLFQQIMTLSIGNNKSTGMLKQKFSSKLPFSSLNTKVFPLKCFAIYGM